MPESRPPIEKRYGRALYRLRQQLKRIRYVERKPYEIEICYIQRAINRRGWHHDPEWCLDALVSELEAMEITSDSARRINTR